MWDPEEHEDLDEEEEDLDEEEEDLDEEEKVELPPLQNDIDDDERERLAPIVAAVHEYAERTGDIPRVRRNGGLRGVEMNPPYYRAVYDAEFLRKCEEAVIVCRDAPERFEELYARAMAEAATKEGGPWLNLLELTQADIFTWGDGEVGWIINRDDLLAQRFDRVRQTYNC